MEKKDSFGSIVSKGIKSENPVFKLLLGLCPAMAVSNSAINAIGMGVSTMCVLICSNIVISLIKNIVPQKVRIPTYIVVIAGFVSIVQLLVKAFLPSLDESLGIFLPLIVVNCVVLARAEIYASKNGVLSSIYDAIGMGIGFTLALTALGAIRELLGEGSIFGYEILTKIMNPMVLFILPPGGFIVFGFIVAILNKCSYRKVTDASCEGCSKECSMKK